jgi:predicted permease
MIYTWGIAVLVPQGAVKKSVIKSIMNPPTVATLVGIVVGLTGLKSFFPSFITSTVTQLGSCVGPIAMIIGGFTVANYSIPIMLKNKKVYIVTAIRLLILPVVMVSALFGLRALLVNFFDMNINNSVLFLCLIATSAPLGLNTIVFPEAYGGDPKTGASMATISHTLGVITVPIMFAIATLLFGAYGT